MPKFRKRPVVIDAEQFEWRGYETRPLAKGVCHCQGDDYFHVHTIHDNQIVFLEHGDWVIPEPDGIHYYPCKPDIFAATYEPVEELAPRQQGAR